eukprot:7271251-Alexandrium_andersonii.AAC.1
MTTAWDAAWHLLQSLDLRLIMLRYSEPGVSVAPSEMHCGSQNCCHALKTGRVLPPPQVSVMARPWPPNAAM